MPAQSSRQRETWALVIFFCAALLTHFFLTTRNWTAGFMPGHEFRQAQTAIVSQYIDQQDNFSLLYETPILGKPWVSILMEVPLYQWTVVLLSRATDLPHHVAARAVSLGCFYLSLPAMYLLLGRMALPAARRLLVLGLIVLAPVYIFYSRAFLMDSMVVMFSAWFLLGFVRTMEQRSWAWLAVTIVAGTGAALVKSITFAVWLLPAAAYGFWLLWRDIRAGTGWRAPMITVLWGAATIAVAFGALRAWVSFTDPIKEAHASAFIFTSSNLSLGNWGLFDFRAAFAPKTWGILFERWREALMMPWIFVALFIAGSAAFPSIRRRALGLAAVFFGAQLLFPFAYAYQDYYYYACAAFGIAALGLVVIGALDSKLPRAVALVLLAVPVAAQLYTYWNGYREAQLAESDGGYPFTDAIADLTPENSVFVVAGSDWAAMAPLYAKRKALMVRNGLEHDAAYLKRAFGELDDEDVAALLVTHQVRGNQNFLRLAGEAFDLDVSQPTFSNPVADVYVRRLYAPALQARIRGSRKYGDVSVPPSNPTAEPSASFDIPPAVARTAFSNVTPAPFRAYFQYGLDRTERDGKAVLSAHPDADLWLRSPETATTITWEYGFGAEAYQREGDKTDGVEFTVTAESPDGTTREVFRRVLNPVFRDADRGHQVQIIPYTPQPGDVLRFSSRPYVNASYDWVYWSKIDVK